MSDHEHVRQLLALSAAGLLDPGEERLVREHARQCAACAAELEEFAALSAGLSALPAPQPPADLVQPDHRAAGRRGRPPAGRRFRRRGGSLCLRLAYCLMGQMLRMLVGDAAALAWLVWASISSVLGTASALVLASRRRLERRIV